ncbi:hypothetical protein DL766_007094 [Monosporascus sp. MC13-8B]|uniref:DNA polymerase delta subunit 3 n=1 Tax=Monosporascus cannonballus TaxID=155416 RepID=A0ABY0GVD3_9PEZI|nr:hypothetical protein DL762_010114 [Monosporascus cannonballus]RYO89959.1 hypothetical protein DL763_005515 [Monosporascus cannonballus]RYP25375.1 hypothetical protein DL766_007094 [Monosporascus sp. MC13-8B]
MDECRRYLAQQLLTEDKLVTYRLLSRALKVHVDTAKEMLYEFHKWQNDKKPGSLHATYLVYGTLRKVDRRDGDVEMTDSQTSEDDHIPFSDEVPTQTLSLVKEEQLQGKRERRGPGPKPVASSPVSTPNIESKSQVKQETKPASPSMSAKEEPKAAQSVNKKEPAASSTAKKTPAAPSLKRQGSSGIGQMFAKAASKAKKPVATATPTGSKTSSTAASGAEDEPSMALSDDGEDDTEPTPDVKQEDSSARRTRRDRQAELRRMMEESDEEETESKPHSPAEEPVEEEPRAPVLEPKVEEPTEVISSSGDGRRRGRRRVMHKKQIMDDQGYLVTIQEPGWESFSEEEAPPTQKPKPAKTTQPAAKSKKPAAKGSQGNIMSFFGKK